MLRRFPDVARHAPACAGRPSVSGEVYEHQTSHYGSRPEQPRRGDWLLGGACLLMRRTMLEEIGGWDGGYRHYVEDIDLAYPALPRQAGSAGSSLQAVVRHAYAAVIDKRFLSRHTIWHARGMARDTSASTASLRFVAGDPSPQRDELERDDGAERRAGRRGSSRARSGRTCRRRSPRRAPCPVRHAHQERRESPGTRRAPPPEAVAVTRPIDGLLSLVVHRHGPTSTSTPGGLEPREHRRLGGRSSP